MKMQKQYMQKQKKIRAKERKMLTIVVVENAASCGVVR